ncbi:MAG: isoleucine--tRNA ligase [Clostridiales bacterium]|nr:isoleucine--tRNA ligase [Clostridiales bacterium]
MAKDYNATVNLPKTDFPMRAALPKREPDMLQSWYDMDLYHQILERTKDRPSFILHDGPPFSNGHIHMGTAMNKCLKDFIVRYKSMSGYHAPYTPGWDNHGMPIESAIIKEQKLNHKSMSIPEFRNACHAFAERFVGIQRDQFKRLGCLGDWEHPYLTMNPKFEAQEVRVFGRMFEKGYIYKGKKPVYWCPHDETALAEAEIEYADDPVTTIFVKFPVADDLGKLSGVCDLKNTYFVIWTTTTWTLPGNLAICLNAAYDYSVVRASNGENYIMAKELAPKVLEKAGLTIEETLCTRKGADFELMTAKHPLFDQTSLVINGDHVTLDAGTGCVHTAPAYGADDFLVCQRYEQLPSGRDLIVNVGDDGRFNEYAGKYAGLHVQKAHEPIFNDLVEAGLLLASENIVHSYPHCWRCKKPIIFRATDQWFCSVDAFKDEAVAAADGVTWMPDWGHDRMVSMIRERADWCISRQRNWGLPIPVFYCAECGKPICTPETIDRISAIFGERGSNAWFELDAKELLPEGFACTCGCTEFTKETDTLDGWFDSGSTHVASMELDAPGCWPADLYLEGGDQYRGWFQSSLLIGVATRGGAPYRAVLTHGWTVDGEGRAMHKSLGNGVYPEELVPKYGADLVRLWAASADYHLDMRCSEAIFRQLSDKYLKIRNTARYILGNLAGYTPDKAVEYASLLPMDKWALGRLAALVEKCLAAYERYEFYSVTYAIHNFCVVDMSNFYLDVLKDRLYCDGAESLSRRAAQTTIHIILDAIVRLLAPILAFTSNEIWLAMPHRAEDDARHVMLNDMPAVHPDWKLDEQTSMYWDSILRLRGDVNKALELARADKTVGKPLDAKVTLYVGAEAERAFAAIADADLAALCIVSELEVVHGAGEGWAGEGFQGVTVRVEPSALPRCVRCWTHSNTVGHDAEHSELCARCAAAVSE